MNYVNDPRKNIHSVYIKEKMINSYAFSPVPVILSDGNTACWFTPCDATKVVKDLDGYISQINDISGNNRHLKQPNYPYACPTWSPNGAKFDGSGEWMRTDPFTLIQPEMVYIVFRRILQQPGSPFIFDGFNYGSMVLYQHNDNNVKPNNMAMYAVIQMRTCR